MSVLVPTKHERDNVGELVHRLDRALAPCRVDWEVVFVDDSADETPQAIRDLAADRPDVSIRLIHRAPNERVGSIAGALMVGFRSTDADVLVVLDADLQHPPEMVPQMIAPLLTGRADLCVPSRYLSEGSAAGLERRWRRMASRASGLLVKLAFREARRVSDPAGGVFAFRREVIDGVVLRPCGFKMLVEILVRGRWRTHCEFAYRFEVRDGGTSEAMLRDGVPFVRHLARLWLDTRVRARPMTLPRRRVAPVDPVLIAPPWPGSA